MLLVSVFLFLHWAVWNSLFEWFIKIQNTNLVDYLKKIFTREHISMRYHKTVQSDRDDMLEDEYRGGLFLLGAFIFVGIIATAYLWITYDFN